MADFFISYRGTDVQWAQWIAWQLQQAGSEVIYQAADFRDGPPIIRQINQALASARCTIAVISPGYFESEWCRIEWETAYTLEVKHGTRRLLLVVIQPTDLPPVLKARAWVELSGMDESAAKERLLSAVSDEKKPFLVLPSFPDTKFGVQGFNVLDIADASPLPGLASITPPDHFPGRSNIWNVPHPWNPNFVGRDELLAELRRSLVAGDRAAVTQAVTGLGGVGNHQVRVIALCLAVPGMGTVAPALGVFRGYLVGPEVIVYFLLVFWSGAWPFPMAYQVFSRLFLRGNTQQIVDRGAVGPLRALCVRVLALVDFAVPEHRRRHAHHTVARRSSIALPDRCQRERSLGLGLLHVLPRDGDGRYGAQLSPAGQPGQRNTAGGCGNDGGTGPVCPRDARLSRHRHDRRRALSPIFRPAARGCR